MQDKPQEVEETPMTDHAEAPKDLCEVCDAIEAKDTEGKPAIVHNPDCPSLQPKAPPPVRLPPWVVFAPGEEIPLKGFRFKVVGYSKGKFELILACVGQTGKAAKRSQGR